jgi:hypothetical protein
MRRPHRKIVQGSFDSVHSSASHKGLGLVGTNARRLPGFGSPSVIGFSAMIVPALGIISPRTPIQLQQIDINSLFENHDV